MECLWSVLPEVEDHVWIGEVGGWVPLLTVKEIWELDWIIDEEDWGVVSNHIIVAFLGVELDGKATWISNSVSCTSLTGNGGESKEEWSLLANLIQEGGLGEFCHILGDFEDTMSTGSLSMHNTLWNSLPIEMGKFINKSKVLKDNWSLGASGH